MSSHKPILSEAPNALDGALELLDAEIERQEKEERTTREVEARIMPFVLKIARKRGLIMTLNSD